MLPLGTVALLAATSAPSLSEGPDLDSYLLGQAPASHIPGAGGGCKLWGACLTIQAPGRKCFFFKDPTDSRTIVNACRGSTERSMVYDASKLPAESYTPSSPESHLEFQSPLPYVVAGLAAMIFLILFALFVLACSFVRREFVADVEVALRPVQRGQAMRQVITVSGPASTHFPSTMLASVSVNAADCRSVTVELTSNEHQESKPRIELDKVAVIMAGEDKPTYLAQPHNYST